MKMCHHKNKYTYWWPAQSWCPLCLDWTSAYNGTNCKIQRKDDILRQLLYTESHFQFSCFMLRDRCLSGSDECWGKSTGKIQTASVIMGSSCYMFVCVTLHMYATYLWAKPSDMALISLGGSPVMRPSIWLLMHLISSATAGLWTQLTSSFSWKPEVGKYKTHRNNA